MRLLILLLVCAPLGVLANHHKSQELPREMVVPCDGKAEGDSCQFSRESGERIQGQCQLARGQMICHPSSEHRSSINQELLKACHQRVAGEACSFSVEGGNSIEGHCEANPEGELFCKHDR
ncbi:hypothetical protein [Ferrimonas marina]|uniref:Uncharacterized protein n=1 Tax=Ferrimonas marina TaxID=299255 RepID=A0A1M5VEQ4_9GAMM|nr:hypothetical protein [Ferrimonas marina]SHH73638.1 hypothetical protein SAMN02745129_2738 [Ferrimonas marina]